jgi:hypothetical protein
VEPSSDRPIRITPDELDRAVPLSMRGFAPPVACPVCGITNDGAAIECRSCGEPFDPSPGAVRTAHTFVPRRPAEELHAARAGSTILFCVSLIAVLAPVVIVLGLVLLVTRHQALVQSGAAYVALAYTSVLLSLVYSGLAVWAVLNVVN